jgi:hypothetical protein
VYIRLPFGIAGSVQRDGLDSEILDSLEVPTIIRQQDQSILPGGDSDEQVEVTDHLAYGTEASAFRRECLAGFNIQSK